MGQASDTMLGSGRYELLEPIDAGGMGEVWLGRQVGGFGFERRVAIKRPTGAAARDPEQLSAFLEEARVSSLVRHANVVELLDVGQDASGQPFMVLEHLDGVSLARLLQEMSRHGEPVSLSLALYVAAELARGLHAIHECRDRDGTALAVVHRDISPHNLMVTREGRVKVIDLGLAKGRRRQLQSTETGIVKGKLAYMAPEQARSEPLDRRADVWAAGAVLYRMLVGVSPHGSRGAADLIADRRSLKAVQLPDTLPEPVRAVLSRALAPLPNERTGTAAEFADALEALGGALSTHRRLELGALVKRYGERAAAEGRKRLMTPPAQLAITARPPARAAAEQRQQQQQQTGGALARFGGAAVKSVVVGLLAGLALVAAVSWLEPNASAQVPRTCAGGIACAR